MYIKKILVRKVVTEEVAGDTCTLSRLLSTYTLLLLLLLHFLLDLLLLFLSYLCPTGHKCFVEKLSPIQYLITFNI